MCFACMIMSQYNTKLVDNLTPDKDTIIQDVLLSQAAVSDDSINYNERRSPNLSFDLTADSDTDAASDHDDQLMVPDIAANVTISSQHDQTIHSLQAPEQWDKDAKAEIYREQQEEVVHAQASNILG